MMAGMTLTPLNAAAIVDSLSASAAGMFALEIHDSVGSTNDVVREFLLADDSRGVYEDVRYDPRDRCHLPLEGKVEKHRCIVEEVALVLKNDRNTSERWC